MDDSQGHYNWWCDENSWYYENATPNLVKSIIEKNEKGKKTENVKLDKIINTNQRYSWWINQNEE